MTHPKEADTAALIAALHSAGVRFIVDPLCELEPGQGYEELLPHTEVMHDEGIEIRVVDLPTLIEIKSKVGRAKDKLAVGELIAILEERRRET